MGIRCMRRRGGVTAIATASSRPGRMPHIGPLFAIVSANGIQGELTLVSGPFAAWKIVGLTVGIARHMTRV